MLMFLPWLILQLPTGCFPVLEGPYFSESEKLSLCLLWLAVTFTGK